MDVVIWALTRENQSSGFENNKGTDQPVHPHLHRLISAFVILSLESIILKLATSKISIFWLVSAPEETGLSLALVEIPKTCFVALRPIYDLVQNVETVFNV